MDKYFFVLGRYPEISVSEISTVLQKSRLNPKLLFSSVEIAVFETAKSENLDELFALLGGSIKYGKVLSEASLSDKETQFNLFFELPFLEKNLLPKRSGKIHFGISVYDAGAQKEIVSKLEENLNIFNSNIKTSLKNGNISSGFLRIKERKLSSVAVERNGLIDKGFEMVLIAREEKIFVGKTLAVFDFDSFAKRDILRPKKDKKSGILPVKLARMMVNLLPVNPQNLLDPFCGSGTVLMEAALMNIKNLTGSDISHNAVTDTQNNLDWLFKTSGIKKVDYNLKFLTSDIRSILNLTGENYTDAIVTEPFLGPPLFKTPDKQKADNIISGLTPLYRETLRVFHKMLKSKGNVVMVFPFIQSPGQNYFMDKINIAGTNFKIENSWLYSSPGQFVGREIVLLSKK